MSGLRVAKSRGDGVKRRRGRTHFDTAFLSEGGGIQTSGFSFGFFKHVSSPPTPKHFPFCERFDFLDQFNGNFGRASPPPLRSHLPPLVSEQWADGEMPGARGLETSPTWQRLCIDKKQSAIFSPFLHVLVQSQRTEAISKNEQIM